MATERVVMKFAYADPPYIGQARRRYQMPEVDHKELIAQLVNDYPDGWALSCHSPSLRDLLLLCPSDVRVAAWVKPFCAFKVNVNPAYTWEPVIFRTRRKRTRLELTVKDHLIHSITLQKRLCGAKPARFCQWILSLLGYYEGDTLDDLFPGTKIMSKVMAQQRIL